MKKNLKKLFAYVCAICLFIAGGNIITVTSAEEPVASEPVQLDTVIIEDYEAPMAGFENEESEVTEEPEVIEETEITEEPEVVEETEEPAEPEVVEEPVVTEETEETEVTEEPVVTEETEEAEVTEEVEAPAEEQTEVENEAEEKFTVTIYYVNVQDYYLEGDILTIASTIEGECNEPAYQWQVRHFGSESWNDIEGANSSTYSYEMNDENCADSFRVVVTDLAAK